MALNALRSTGKDVTELNGFVLSLVRRINEKYSKGTYKPIVWLDRPVPLYEKIALYSVADVAVVAATRDGMNLVPYEYIVCREGPEVHACPLQRRNAWRGCRTFQWVMADFCKPRHE